MSGMLAPIEGAYCQGDSRDGNTRLRIMARLGLIGPDAGEHGQVMLWLDIAGPGYADIPETKEAYNSCRDTGLMPKR